MRTLVIVLCAGILSTAPSTRAAAEPIEKRAIRTWKVTAVTTNGKPRTLKRGDEIYLRLLAGGRWAMASKQGGRVQAIGGTWKKRGAELHLSAGRGSSEATVLAMRVSMRGQMTAGPAAAVRGGAPMTRKTKTSFAQKLGSYASGLASMELAIAAPFIPGGSVVSKALSKAMPKAGSK